MRLTISRRILRHAVPLAGLALSAACATFTGGAAAQDMGLTLADPAQAPLPQVAQSLRADVSRAAPARMLVIGDSLAEGFGAFLQQQTAARGLPIEVQNWGRNSSGLARTDFYDWPENFAARAPDASPDIVVAHFGANDMQSVIEDDRRTALLSDAWDAVYTEQIEGILATAAAQGAVVYLLGPATDSHTNLNNHLARVNPLFQAAAEASGAIYFPLRPFTSGPNGEFSRDVVVNGESVRLRTGDGSHFNARGYRLVADRILDDMVARYRVLDAPFTASAVASVDVVGTLSLQ